MNQLNQIENFFVTEVYVLFAFLALAALVGLIGMIRKSQQQPVVETPVPWTGAFIRDDNGYVVDNPAYTGPPVEAEGRPRRPGGATGIRLTTRRRMGNAPFPTPWS